MLTSERNKISYLHFIMSVLVILIHSINNDTRFERFFAIEGGIGQFATPLFFIISGFLFFRNVRSISDAKNKLRRRVYTLLIPYLLWNLIYYAIHLFLKPGSGISLSEIIDAAFTYKYNPSFWFIYQLILLSIISPIIYYVVNHFLEKKNIRNRQVIMAVGLCVIAEVIVIAGKDIPYINEDAFLYYTFGMIISILYNSGKIILIHKKNTIIYLLALIVAFVLNRFVFHLLLTNPLYYNLFTATVIIVRLIGAMFIFYFVDLFFRYNKVPEFMGQTFFLYAIHYMIVKAMIIFTKYFMYKFIPVGIIINRIDLYTIIECVVFAISPAVCVIINYYLSKFMTKRFTKQYNILVGNRR